MKKIMNTGSKLSNALFIGILVLFTISIISILITLQDVNSANHNPLEAKEDLQKLTILLWVLILIEIGASITLIFWWIQQKKLWGKATQEMAGIINAIYESQAVVEFNMDGTIISANDRFLRAMGYTVDELIGSNHSILVDEAYKASQEYRVFWDRLNRGEINLTESKRLGKNGKEVWLQAVYSPILNSQGKPIKVLKIATDITERKKQEYKLIELTKALTETGKLIAGDSEELSSGIKQLESTAASQASSASEQATSMAEITTTMEELKTTTEQTLEQANQLGNSSEKTNSEAEKMKHSIEQMYGVMQELQTKIDEIAKTILGLNEKTELIGEITESVAEIARQSKMLSLNAAIEAARAGEAGKGFTAVALEVKELAEKSQSSTEHVQKILQDIRHSAEKAVIVTENGSKTVDKNAQQLKLTGEIINSMMQIIEENSNFSIQIVAAIRQESVAIDQINQSIKEVDKVTNIFANASEQTKQAIISLSKVTESLVKTANIYLRDKD